MTTTTSDVKTSVPDSRPETVRDKFLVAMYNQMMNDINRHLTVVWQPVAVLITTFAVLSLSKEISPDKGVISLDVAATLVVLIAAWAAAHIFDASYWYNRNLAIIGNIERIFLEREDAQRVHYYFTSHRPTNGMISYLSIQITLVLGVAAVVLLFHAAIRVRPTCCSVHAPVDWPQTFPYIAAVIFWLYVNYRRNEAEEKYQSFVATSPGLPFENPPKAVGHGTKWSLREKLWMALRLWRA